MTGCFLFSVQPSIMNSFYYIKINHPEGSIKFLNVVRLCVRTNKYVHFYEKDFSLCPWYYANQIYSSEKKYQDNYSSNFFHRTL
jgi:hypothetical protein